MKPGRLWHPLDVEFWDDPDTLAVGESGAVLFLRLIAYAKKHQTNGYVPMSYVKRIGGRRWQAKMEPIVCQGWATLTDETAPNGCHVVAALSDICGAKWCHVVAFLAWNDSSESVEQRREIAREKKRRQRAVSADVPSGQIEAVPGHRVELETELEKYPPLRGGEDDGRGLTPAEAEHMAALAQKMAAHEDQPKSLADRVARQLDLTPTPGSVVKLLELLSALHCRPDGAPYAEPGMPSSNDRKMLVGVIQRGDMRTIAAEWVAMLALVASGDKPDIRNPLAYFAKCFGGLEAARLEANAPFPPAIQEAA